jgi:hypothetical protein
MSIEAYLDEFRSMNKELIETRIIIQNDEFLD